MPRPASKRTAGFQCPWQRARAYGANVNGNNSVWCPDRNPKLTGAWVHVHSNGRIKYVQTVADGRKTDNLLSLPDM